MKGNGDVVKLKAKAEKHIIKCKQEAFVAVSKYSVSDDHELIIIDSNTLVKNVASFNISEKCLKNYYTPELISIASAKQQEANFRVSIRGRVKKVKPSKPSFGEVVLTEEEHTIKLMLWGDKKSLIGKPHEHRELIVTAVEVNVYDGKVSLSSTPSTNIDVSIRLRVS